MTEMNTIPVYVLIGVYDDRSITTSFAFTNFDTAKKYLEASKQEFPHKQWSISATLLLQELSSV